MNPLIPSNFPLMIRCHYRSSRYLVFLFIVIHLGILVIFWQLKLPFLAFLFVISLWVIQSIYLIKNKILQSKHNLINEFILRSEQPCIIIRMDGSISEAILMGNSYIGRCLIIFNFYLLNSCREESLVLMPDSIDKEKWRSLRAFLAIYKGNFLCKY